MSGNEGSQQKPVLAYAIKAPDGVLIVKSDNDTEEKAWKTIFPEIAEIARGRGYRCVRVQITEVPE